MNYWNEYIEDGVLIQEIDILHLEEGLVRTAALIDRHRDFVVLFSHYKEMLARHHSLDIAKLSEMMGVRMGLLEDKDAVLASGPAFRHVHVSYGRDVEEAIEAIVSVIVTLPDIRDRYSKRYMAIRLLESPEEMLSHLPHSPKLVSVAAHERVKLLEEYGLSPAQIIRNAREGFVHGALEETVTHAPNDTGHTFFERLDKVLTHRWIGLPILFAVLYLVFQCSFVLGAYPQMWLASMVDALCGILSGILPAGWLSSLIIDGIVRGVGAVLSFVPNIFILFVFLCLLEDTGYMSRAAFLMDKIMHRVGLHGSSFIPMLVGFGCNVPAIMAARTIENKKDRTLTILMIPFMSCSARLPVYMLFVGAFFPEHQALVMISLYLIGIVLSILFALVMKHTRYFRQSEKDYVSVLPPFRKPTWRNTGLHVWERLWDYLQKIGTVIIWASVIIWALTYFPSGMMDMESSWLVSIGQFAAPVMRPLGFDWQMSVCLLTGLPAKEAIISTMGILYQGDMFASAFTPLTAFTFMLFVLLYFPCIATVSTIRREIGRKWACFTVVHSLCLAWVTCFIVYQIGLLL